MNHIRQTILEVDTKAISHNIKEIKKYVGEQVDVMPIIKANGYGSYINQRFDIFNDCNIKIVGVAIVDEGIDLRESGYEKEIFILNQPIKEEIEKVIQYNLIIGVGSVEFLDELGQFKDEIKIHMEIGTGMGRTGINPYRVKEYIETLEKYPNIKLEGIYTHFSCSDCDEQYTKTQLKSFHIALKQLKEKIDNIQYIHCANSAGILNFKESHFNLVRPGIMLYGYLPEENLKNKIDLIPSLKLKSRISFLKTVPKDRSISYARTFITTRETKIATIPIGYADGIKRALSNKGKVVINGKLANIIGRVCMDAILVDVTDLENVKVNDEVYLWDNQNITIEDISKVCDTINYEIISTISNRVIRKFIFE